MSEEKYCKFCNKTKSIKEFVKSGMCVKNICKECHNKKQRQTYQNNKLVEELQQRIDEAIEFINEYCKYNKITVNGNKYYDEYILNNVIDILRGDTNVKD